MPRRPTGRVASLGSPGGMALVGCLLASTGWAAPVDPFEEPDESELFRMDERLVTVASRYAQTVRMAPSIVSVVTAEDIRERGYRTLSDLLRDLPGIYVWKSPEGLDLATFRGVVSGDNNKVLLLVDGVPWYDGAYTHAFVGDYLPISHVEQVEVIKGPGSAIYGTNAFSGVVNVVTRSAEALRGGTVRWVGGAPARSDLCGMVGARSRVGGIDVEATAYVRSLEQTGDGLDLTPRGRHNVLGEDPKRNLAVGASLDLEGLQLQIHHVDHRHSYLLNEADDPWDIAGKDLDQHGLIYHDTFFDLRYRARLGTDTVITPNLWSQRHDNPGSYFFLDGYTTEEVDGVLHTEQNLTQVETEKDTRRWGARVDLETRLGIDHVTVAGVGLENITVLEFADYEYEDLAREPPEPTFQAPAGSSLRNLFAYGQHTWTPLPYLEATAGLRLDKRVPTGGQDPSKAAFDLFASPRLGLLVVPGEALTAKVLYGRAFRSPSVRELLVQAELDPETQVYPWANGSLRRRAEYIDTFEAEAIVQLADPVQVRVDGFYSYLGREIDKVSPPNEYRNLKGRLHIVGGEAGVELQVDMVSLELGYALTHARYADVRGNPYRGRRQYEFPPHMVKGATRAALTDHLTATLFGELYSGRPRREWSPDAGVPDGLAFGLLHLGVHLSEVGPGERTSIGLAVRNLTDAEWGTGVYRADVNVLNSDGSTRFPEEMSGEGRSVQVSLEVAI